MIGNKGKAAIRAVWFKFVYGAGELSMALDLRWKLGIRPTAVSLNMFKQKYPGSKEQMCIWDKITEPWPFYDLLDLNQFM